MGSLVGIPNVFHTFRDNVLFVNVCNNLGEGVSVDCELEFILAPGELLFRMECFIVVGESGQGDPWVLERRFDGASSVQSVIFFTRRVLSSLTMRGRTPHFPQYILVLKVVAICAIASTISSMASYLVDPVMRGRSAASERALTIVLVAATLVIGMASSVSVHSAIGMA